MILTLRRRKALGLLLAGAAAVAPGTAARAQEESFVLDQLVVTATGGVSDLRDAPASVSVVTAEDIAQTPATNVAEVLSRVEGITINRVGNQEQVQMRGLPERYTLFLIDGKRVDSAPNLFRGNAFDSGWVPLDAIERIEVVRGPMSSLYGSDAIGGVINIITKPVSNEWHGSLTADYTLQQDRDAGDTWSTGFFLTGPIVEDRLGFKLYGNVTHRDASSDDYNPAPGEDWAVDPWPGFAEQDDRFIHGTLSWAPNVQNTVDLDLGYERRVEGDFPMKRFDYGLTHYGDYDFGTTELRLYGDQIDNEYGHGNVAGVDQPNTAYNRGAEGRVVLPIEGSLPQTLTLGAEYRYQQIDDDYVLTGDGTSSMWQAAVYFEDEVAFGNDFLLTLGTRVDNNEKFGDHWSPRVYGVYNVTESLTIKGGWAQAFKAPTLLESSPNWDQISCGGGCFLRGSEDLDPETGNNYEIGAVFEQGPLALTGTIFRNDLDDMIQFPPARTGDPAVAPTFDNFVGFTSDGIPIFGYENIESARTQGLEAAARYDVTDSVTLRANYTYLDATNTSGGLDVPLAYNPEHSGHLAVEWQATTALFTSVTVNYVGDQYTYVPQDGNMANAVDADAYTTADLMASYDFGENLTLQGGILNLFDETIEREVADDFNVEGRRFYVSLTGRF
ncbi:MAG TPA: TonB-dependent receptor [Amaricoccus sp.]|uniref:TonB-dependent receptor domain-containing protein n=1 Tax=Amaricoccus sp. TaxID=1872485 RepID=UPI002BA325E3|nr:TonB-dependent receptor [Amaricoccus sp.]HMQ92286.1 TonB-dependent receptor [Amaricoccus sp.]HMR51047.1 TonB-dependent receptor [Amaricoccus sp.]HMR60752.1 TonB-dependent receptor [Amaricoccus sp.]HMT97774.1 TonB-dependent receptor [Amaricoccus sp.]